MKKAVDILCRCRQTLRYTYAFAYYLKKNNHTQIFEDNQRDLEMATEKLSEFLERDISHSVVTDMKVFVQDKSRLVYHITRHGCRVNKAGLVVGRLSVK